MVLVKCECGCFFTLKGGNLAHDTLKNCPNCGAGHELGNGTSIRTVETALAPETLAIRIIPDDAKIRISFEA